MSHASSPLVTTTPTTPRSGSGRRQSLRSQVYADLRRRIHLGQVRPGERLVDVDIAAQLGVSRMPARDALLQLTHEGYLVATTRGFTLPSLDLDDMREIFEVRRLLEPRAAALAARDRSAEQLEALAQARQRAAQALDQYDAEAFMRANIDFRQAWMAAVHNRRLADTLRRFVDHVQSVRFGTLSRPDVRDIVMRGLNQLYAAFASRDAVLAHDRMEHFVMSAEEAFFTGELPKEGVTGGPLFSPPQEESVP